MLFEKYLSHPPIIPLSNKLGGFYFLYYTFMFTPIDSKIFQAYTSKPKLRPILAKPFILDGYICATDSFSAVRKKAPIEYTEAPSTRLPDVHAFFPEIKEESYSMDFLIPIIKNIKPSGRYQHISFRDVTVSDPYSIRFEWSNDVPNISMSFKHYINATFSYQLLYEKLKPFTTLGNKLVSLRYYKSDRYDPFRFEAIVKNINDITKYEMLVMPIKK